MNKKTPTVATRSSVVSRRTILGTRKENILSFPKREKLSIRRMRGKIVTDVQHFQLPRGSVLF